MDSNIVGVSGKRRKGRFSKADKWYPTEDEVPQRKKKFVHKPPPLRSTITPGTILILLAGKHKGRRVVFLKQLPSSGMLLVTGPFKVNGVPARRVHQKFVIATSAKVNLPALDLEVFTDDYFRELRTKPKKKKAKTQEDFFEVMEEDEKKDFPKEYYENNRKLDTAIVPVLQDDMKGYLKSFFTLRSGDRPHLMKF